MRRNNRSGSAVDVLRIAWSTRLSYFGSSRATLLALDRRIAPPDTILRAGLPQRSQATDSGRSAIAHQCVVISLHAVQRYS